MIKKFNVGDTAWYSKCRWEPVRKQCPTCFGKKEVVLTLGNDEQVVLPCGGCSPGYTSPTGTISEYEYVVEPVEIRITGLDIEIDGDSESIRYKSDNFRYDDDDLFLTKEEAATRAGGKKAKLDEEQQTRAEYIKQNVHKSFSWNAHYYMREARECRAKALRYDEKAKLCKERVKGGDHE